MPKRSDRKEFSDKFEENNPFKNKSAKHLFKTLRWGTEPTETFDINAPEDMASLGTLAKLYFVDGTKLTFDDEEAPFIAIGKNSNMIYIVDKNPDGSPIDIPSDGFEVVGEVKRTDYYSEKDEEEAYYYHKHEKPFPICLAHSTKAVLILKPNILKNGRPSYVVREEGIIG